MEINRSLMGSFFEKPEAADERAEPFVQVPSIFLCGLTPQQFLALQQTYQIAFERARRDTQGGHNPDDWFGDTESGGGI